MRQLKCRLPALLQVSGNMRDMGRGYKIFGGDFINVKSKRTNFSKVVNSNKWIMLKIQILWRYSAPKKMIN